MTTAITQLECADRIQEEIASHGHVILDDPIVNKGSAFSEDERRELGLLGLLPLHTSTIDEQLARAYENYCRKNSDLGRYIFLTALQDRNETLFYRLVSEHITEMMPIVYTPTVGEGCCQYSHVFRRPRGLYISYPYRNEILKLLDNAPAKNVEVIVVTDGERILGLGDLGVGGMGIPVGKLSLYTLCAGIHPRNTLPILLDAGTDNQDLLNDPLYLGWRHERVRGEQYDDFIEQFVTAVEDRFPHALLQWEDFSKHNAPRILDRYRNRLCTFNDDIQGTGAVTVAGLLSAARLTGTQLSDHRIAILGAGASAIGICDQIVAALVSEGSDEREARSNLWLTDSKGLVHAQRNDLDSFKRKYAQDFAGTREWKLSDPRRMGLLEVVSNVHPTILLGVSAQPGSFTEEIVREMARRTERPVIFPLSNPTSKSEATAIDLFRWTEGRAIIATGSPSPPIGSIGIGQCNNSFIFPGVGLGVIASGARRVTDAMFVAAAKVLYELSPSRHDPDASLYPPLEKVKHISRLVAVSVGSEAYRAGLTNLSALDDLEDRVLAKVWQPEYVSLHSAH